ncbi:hypothetical protein SBDP2_1530002 [Syntrophobacter sp. SbD2]|nr:hypothetical protein SBDP2_1530002 [Syntrophobacter sp. SbD2]
MRYAMYIAGGSPLKLGEVIG